MLVRCLYASRTDHPDIPAMLAQILESSRKHNPALGITGILLMTDNIFIQVLEGGRDEVCQLYNAIVRDTRHRDVTLLTYEEIDERRFENWTMGKVHMEKINPAMILKYSKTAKLDPFSCKGHAVMSLITELVMTGAIVNR